MREAQVALAPLEQPVTIPYFQLLRLLAVAAAEVRFPVHQLLQRMEALVAVDVPEQAVQATPHQYRQVKEAMVEAGQPLLLTLAAVVVAALPQLAVPALVQLREMAATARPQALAAPAQLTLAAVVVALELAALLELGEQAVAAQAAQAQQQGLMAQPTQAEAVVAAAQMLVAPEEMAAMAALASS